MRIKPQAALAIQTKYLGATDTRGERIKAFMLSTRYDAARPDTLTLPYDYALSGSAVHEPAMRKLHEKINHNPDIDQYQEKECNHVAISSWTDTGYIFTFIDDSTNDLFEYTECCFDE